MVVGLGWGWLGWGGLGWGGGGVGVRLAGGGVGVGISLQKLGLLTWFWGMDLKKWIFLTCFFGFDLTMWDLIEKKNREQGNTQSSHSQVTEVRGQRAQPEGRGEDAGLAWLAGLAGLPGLLGRATGRQPGRQAARQPGRQAARQPGGQAARQPGRRLSAPQENIFAFCVDPPKIYIFVFLIARFRRFCFAGGRVQDVGSRARDKHRQVHEDWWKTFLGQGRPENCS